MKSQFGYQFNTNHKPIFQSIDRLAYYQSEIDFLNNELKYSESGHRKCNKEIQELKELVQKLKIGLEKIIKERQEYQSKVESKVGKQVKETRYKIDNEYALLDELRKENYKLRIQIKQKTKLPTAIQEEDLSLVDRRDQQIKKLKIEIQEQQKKIQDQINTVRIDPKLIEKAEKQNQQLKQKIRNLSYQDFKINSDVQIVVDLRTEKNRFQKLKEQLKNVQMQQVRLELELKDYEAREFDFNKKNEVLLEKLKELQANSAKTNPGYQIMLEQKFKRLNQETVNLQKQLKEWKVGGRKFKDLSGSRRNTVIAAQIKKKDTIEIIKQEKQQLESVVQVKDIKQSRKK